METLDRRGRVAGRAGVRDMGGGNRDRAGRHCRKPLIFTTMGYAKATAHYRLSCRSRPTEAMAKRTEEYAAVFHRIDSLERSPSYVAVKLNTWKLPGQSGP